MPASSRGQLHQLWPSRRSGHSTDRRPHQAAQADQHEQAPGAEHRAAQGRAVAGRPAGAAQPGKGQQAEQQRRQLLDPGRGGGHGRDRQRLHQGQHQQQGQPAGRAAGPAAAGARPRGAAPRMHATLPLLATHRLPADPPRGAHTVQVNLGYRCNQSCLHCHVNAGPTRTEAMDAATTIDAVLDRAARAAHRTLDLTGGAPELNPHFRRLVRGARARRARHRPLQPHHPVGARAGGPGGLPGRAGVEVVASLPCYSPSNVDRQRGDGVFERSIAGLRSSTRSATASAGRASC
jgi:hypothetical protein